MKIIILLTMIFCHIVDDFYLQGVLAKMKQKSWWEQNAPDPLYRNDYKIALIEHAFSWTFMMMLPLIVWMIWKDQIEIIPYCYLFGANLIIHAFVDNRKANMLDCSLMLDQGFHVAQIVATWLIMIGFFMKNI